MTRTTAFPPPTAIDRPDQSSAWAPLRIPIYRAFWLASLASNLGTWIHEIGAGWLMTTLDPSPTMVAAVRTVMTVPIVLLAIPVGVLGDRVDRRRLLILTQLVLLSTTSTLATLTFFGAINQWSLLGLTFVMGLGMVVHVPLWQAAVPELVPKKQLSRAIALGSISFNLARAVGPAVGGVLIALAGAWIAFAMNALSFAAVVLVLLFWKRNRCESSRGLSFPLAMFQGLRFVFRTIAMRHVMLGVVLFIFPASAFWALLPLVAKQHLNWGASGYGLIVGCVGAGAVAAAVVLPRFHIRYGADRTIAASMIVFAAGLGTLCNVTTGVYVATAALFMGAAWMMTLTTLNATAQMTLPSRMRARGMGCFLTSMALSMAAGSVVWGQLAEATSLLQSQMLAAVLLLIAALISLRLPIGNAAIGGR